MNVMSDARGSQKRVLKSPKTRITNNHELPCGCLELNPGPVREQLSHLSSP